MSQSPKKGGKVAVRSVVDSTNTTTTTPLDYSFKDLCHIADLTEEEPRNGPKPHSITNVEVAKSSEEREPAAHAQAVVKKYKTNALRLNNNALTEIVGFFEVASTILCQPECLSWVDFSFNRLKTIDPVFVELTELKVLYLHGNEIDKILEVDKLSQLPKLKSLTLHGNPIETGNREAYKQYVVATVPQLKTFDFSGITKSDRATASRRLLMKTMKTSKT